MKGERDMAVSMRRLHLGCGEALSGERYQLVMNRSANNRRKAAVSGATMRGGHKARGRNAKQQ